MFVRMGKDGLVRHSGAHRLNTTSLPLPSNKYFYEILPTASINIHRENLSIQQ
jgi:hypothetical protein